MFVSSNRLGDLWAYFRKMLSGSYESKEIDNMFVLLANHRFGLEKFELHNLNYRLGESELLQINSDIKRLATGEPVQYLIGEVDFFDCCILVSPAVLIPRPETEELAALAVESIGKNNFTACLDLCSGSGCISVAIAHHCPEVNVTGVDISAPAIEIAQRSSKKNNTQVHFECRDILNVTTGGFSETDIMVANPPYIPRKDEASLRKNVREFEPDIALFVPDSDSLIFYRRIAQIAQQYLKPKGQVLMEINPEFASDIAQLWVDAGFRKVKTLKDLQGFKRFVSVSNSAVAD